MCNIYIASQYEFRFVLLPFLGVSSLNRLQPRVNPRGYFFWRAILSVRSHMCCHLQAPDLCHG